MFQLFYILMYLLHEDTIDGWRIPMLIVAIFTIAKSRIGPGTYKCMNG
jgi:hypothetical protein